VRLDVGQVAVRTAQMLHQLAGVLTCSILQTLAHLVQGSRGCREEEGEGQTGENKSEGWRR